MDARRDNEEGNLFTPTVLIIDDEPEIREIYALHLSQDFDVQTASDGDVSLAKIREEIDIIFLDRHMPGIGGDEFLHKMRANGLETPVIFISAVDPEKTPDLSYKAYLTKPISGGELKHHVEKYTQPEVVPSAD